MYEKYRRNLKDKENALNEPFAWGEERGLMLEEIDDTEFYEFLETFNQFISKMRANLLNDSKKTSENVS
ncbi:hypothetical protein JXL21_09175 [Candidatus Bathyarchaeota archaeon]|nr:hypothetical protein [Candidatus Bathyarchaeota archaeon]